MINIFRKIRQGLLKQGKISKYLIYAVGEIILVAIGILIALAVNNKNNQRINDLRVERFIGKLQVQLEDNLLDVNDEIENATIFYRESKDLLSIIGDTKEEYKEEEIDQLILYNAFDYQVNLDMNIVMEARENGDLALISNDSLSTSIYQLTTFYNKIIEDERITNSNLNNHFTTYLSENYNFKNLLHRIADEDEFKKSKIYRGDNYKMLVDQKFESLITLRIILSKELLDSYIELRELILDIYELLNIQIESGE